MELTGNVAWRLVRSTHVTARTAAVRALERRAGIHTGGVISPEELGFSSDDGHRYISSHWFTLYRILKRRETRPDDVFVDFGSGMGRVVYQAAAHYRFRRVEGVELSADLTRIAQDNIDRNRHRLGSGEIRLVSCNALEYEIPDDMTIAYFYNPFSGPVFAGVLARVEASLERNPRRLRLIYVNPLEERMVLEAGFRMTRELRGLRPGRAWARSNAARLYERPASR